MQIAKRFTVNGSQVDVDNRLLYNLRVDEGGSFYASKRPYENGNVRGVVLRDGVYFISVAVYAGHGDGVDVYAEFDGLLADAAPNVHGNFDLHFAWSGRLAGIRRRTKFGTIAQPGRRILFRVADCLSVIEHGEGRDAEYQTLLAGEHFNCDADNLRGRAGVDDFAHGNRSLASVYDGGVAVYRGRLGKSGACVDFGS